MGGHFAITGKRSFPIHRWRWGDGICVGCCRGWEGFSTLGGGGGRGSQRRDVALGDSRGTVAYRTMLQVTMGVLIAWGRRKENKLLGLEGTDRFADRTAVSSSPIPVRLLPGPIGRIGVEA